jgi:hypothetical protein
VFLALGAQIVRDLVGTGNIFVIGLLLAVLTLVDLALLELAATAHSLPLFVATTIVGGTAYGLLFSGGLGLINTHAPANHRGGTLSAVYLVAYILQGAIALTLGLVATASGLSTALLIGVTVIATLALLVIAAATIRARSAKKAS